MPCNISSAAGSKDWWTLDLQIHPGSQDKSNLTSLEGQMKKSRSKTQHEWQKFRTVKSSSEQVFLLSENNHPNVSYCISLAQIYRKKKPLLHFSLGHDPKYTQSCPGSQIHWEQTHSLGVTSWGLISFLPDNKIIIIEVLADRHWLIKSKINTNCRHIIKKESQYLTLGQTQAKIRSELRTNPSLVMSLMFLLKVSVCNSEKPEI